MSQPRDNKRVKRKCSRPYENKSTQTERNRSTNESRRRNGSVILKVTDYTKFDDADDQNEDDTSLSDTSSAQSLPKRQALPIVTVRSWASQTSNEWRESIVDNIGSASDSDDSINANTKSYDFLEHEPVVTSLTDLRLSDSEEEQEHLYVTEITSNEEKLAKL
uniref:Uncharacterized protein n=1 Tax=Ceratitis capitata TaxID=7213 RepID=W8CA99_CERCA